MLFAFNQNGLGKVSRQEATFQPRYFTHIDENMWRVSGCGIEFLTEPHYVESGDLVGDSLIFHLTPVHTMAIK